VTSHDERTLANYRATLPMYSIAMPRLAVRKLEKQSRSPRKISNICDLGVGGLTHDVLHCNVREVLGEDSKQVEECCFLGYDAVWRNVSPPSSG
jgi:hypothetical protein